MMSEVLFGITPETHVPFVYCLVDPEQPEHVRYVGMAPVRVSRPFEHAKFARKATTKSTHLVNWIRKIQAEGRDPAVLVLEQLPESASQRFAGLIERMYIKSLREIGHKLTNVHEGGWGGDTGRKGKPGTPHTEQSLANLRKALLGHVVTPETCLKISEARKGKGHPHSEETLAQMRADRGTPEARAALSAKLLGRVVSEGTRIKLRNSWTPERLAANTAESLRSPEAQLKSRSTWNTRRDAAAAEDSKESKSAKLVASQIRAIRADTRPGVVVAADYKVTPATISLIRAGKIWKRIV